MNDTNEKPEEPALRTPKPGEQWRHWKNGDLVTVLHVVRHCDTKQRYVVYLHRTPEGDEWIRSLVDWHDNTDPRFAPRARFEFEDPENDWPLLNVRPSTPT